MRAAGGVRGKAWARLLYQNVCHIGPVCLHRMSSRKRHVSGTIGGGIYGGAEVSDMYHIGPTYGMAAAVIWAIYAWYKVVPFGEIEANPSDPKHVG